MISVENVLIAPRVEGSIKLFSKLYAKTKDGIRWLLANRKYIMYISACLQITSTISTVLPNYLCFQGPEAFLYIWCSASGSQKSKMAVLKYMRKLEIVASQFYSENDWSQKYLLRSSLVIHFNILSDWTPKCAHTNNNSFTMFCIPVLRTKMRTWVEPFLFENSRKYVVF